MQYAVNLAFVSCKNRIFPKNPVFLHTSDHKIKVNKAQVLCQHKTEGCSFFVTFAPSLCSLRLKIRQTEQEKGRKNDRKNNQ